jgi:hypothetical protein
MRKPGSRIEAEIKNGTHGASDCSAGVRWPWVSIPHRKKSFRKDVQFCNALLHWTYKTSTADSKTGLRSPKASHNDVILFAKGPTMHPPVMNHFRFALPAVCFLLVPVLGVAQVRQQSDSREAASQSVKAADPFDTGTGIYSREYVDLIVKDTIPINFTRTQRNMDSKSRSFGIGGSTAYDLFIVGDVDHFSWVALVLANGTQIRYGRISPGVGYADGVFENRASPGAFLGSRISWNRRGAWTVTLPDGAEYTVQGCSAKSRPGQCAVSEIKNAQGERLTIQRDQDGNILKIVSPHGHFISVTNDSDGRITRAEDDSKRWVAYRYDDRGCLREAQDWRGDHQKFTYDGRFNMTFVHEKSPGTGKKDAYDFTVTNTYDGANRFKTQRVSTGESYSAKYTTDGDGHIRENDVQGTAGLSRYFFNAQGYETRQEFRPVEGSGWSLDRTLDPTSNATVGVILHCQTAKIRLPLKMDTPLQESGESRIPYLASVCEREEKKLQSQGNPTPKN